MVLTQLEITHYFRESLSYVWASLELEVHWILALAFSAGPDDCTAGAAAFEQVDGWIRSLKTQSVWSHLSPGFSHPRVFIVYSF